MLDREHLARAAETGEHLVGDEQRADLVREFAQDAEIAWGRDDGFMLVPWIGSTMIAATSLVVSTSIFLRRNSTQCQLHDGNVLSNAQRAHDAYGVL